MAEIEFDGVCLACGEEPAEPDAFLGPRCLPQPEREPEPPTAWQPSLWGVAA